MKITKFGHACLLVEEGDARILIDPGAFSDGFEQEGELDAVLVTHQHQDHITPETLAKIRVNNPDVPVYGDSGTCETLGEENVTQVQAGDELDIAGVQVKVFGRDHAVIHPKIPGIGNVGYMIGGRLFHPGDNFTEIDEPVEILALPLGAPWSKVSEVINYTMAVKPKVAIPIHDAVLAMPDMHKSLVERFAGPAGIEVRVVENGSSTEV